MAPVVSFSDQAVLSSWPFLWFAQGDTINMVNAVRVVGRLKAEVLDYS